MYICVSIGTLVQHLLRTFYSHPGSFQFAKAKFMTKLDITKVLCIYGLHSSIVRNCADLEVCSTWSPIGPILPYGSRVDPHGSSLMLMKMLAGML